MRNAALLAFLLILACGKPASQPVNVNDTEEILSEPIVSAETDEPIEPELAPVAETQIPAVSKQSARDAFTEYADNRSLNYTFVSAELLKQQDGVDYYRVKYSFGTGNRYAVVDSAGTVYDEIYMP